MVEDAFHHHAAPGDLGDTGHDATHDAPDLLQAIGNSLRMAWEFVTEF